MFVDDEAFIRNFMNTTLDSMRISVRVEAKDGLEAVMKYKELNEKREQRNLIILDINMPHINGKEAAKAIRKYEREEEIE